MSTGTEMDFGFLDMDTDMAYDTSDIRIHPDALSDIYGCIISYVIRPYPIPHTNPPDTIYTAQSANRLPRFSAVRCSLFAAGLVVLSLK